MESLRKKENNEAQVLNNVKRWICKNCLHSQIELLKRDLSEPKTDLGREREKERKLCVWLHRENESKWMERFGKFHISGRSAINR